jgi:hypothetical protein
MIWYDLRSDCFKGIDNISYKIESMLNNAHIDT